ncbi:toll-like receptor 6 isoform X2 [Topomyia yanbarensis]|uniref:toll-like receptor 6 isoform X2 n=1 Tax=Topomyia yanbarensis TaxID=2498891 RepID=UPI00273B00B1|nr:toll-like receptor 6 isoform X2 [Topomyia yanbarensis]
MGLSTHITVRLMYLSMARSGLSTLPMFELTLVNSTLTHLSLMGNVLIPFKLPVLRNLRVLDLRSCGLSYLPEKTFVNTPSLLKLFLSHNSLTKLCSTQLFGLSNLRHLDISYNTQEKLAELTEYDQPDPYNSLTEGLILNEDTFAPLVNLSFLDVSHTKLLSYSSKAFRNVAVEQLSLCYTGIAIIVGSMMNGSLRVLDISGNPGISTAIHHEKSDLRGFNVNLEILVCENSTVKHLDWLSGMVNLKVLLLGSNNINQLKNHTFENLASLEILDLSGNHISNWHQRVFENNAELYILDLSDNNINVLTTEMLYDFASVNFLAIGQNSFVCHCLLREFIEMAAKNSETISCLLYNLVNHLQDNQNQTKYDDVLHFLHNSGYSTSSSLLDFSTRTTPVDKRRKVIEFAIGMDSSLEKQLSSYEYQSSTVLDDDFEREDVVESLEEYDVLYRVVQSYVSNIYDSNSKFQESLNKYRYEPSDPRFISINCNNETDTTNLPPYVEEPDITDPLYGLQFQIIDFDEDSYKCIDLDDSEFYLLEQERCILDRAGLLPFLPISNSTTAYIIKFTLIFFGFALVAFIIYISKWEHIKYFCIIVRNATILSMMTHKSEPFMRKESLASVTSCYTYDVFVSYSEQDRQWVLEQLLPNLEQTEDINVCLHERDFKVGISILENIIYCMDKSRTLLLVMSESFLLSHWCQFEMHLAQHRLLETRREQLILVLLEDIPKSKRPKTLHYLMKTKTYIIWPQPVPEKKSKHSKQDKDVKNSSKAASRKEKDIQALNEERSLFWQRLRKAIHAGVAWEPFIGGGAGEASKAEVVNEPTEHNDPESSTQVKH